MRDSMPAVEENSAAKRLKWILSHDPDLHHQILGNLLRANPCLSAVALAKVEPLSPYCLMLDHLGATIGDEFRGKRLEEVGVDHDELGEMESASEVLAIWKIAPRLAAS